MSVKVPSSLAILQRTQRAKQNETKIVLNTPLEVPMPLFFCFSNQEIPGSLTFSLVLTVHLQRMYQCRTFRTRFRSTGIPQERVLDRRVGMGPVGPQCLWKAVSANACQSTQAWRGSAKTSFLLVIAGFRRHRWIILLEKLVTDLFHHNFGIISTV